MSANSPAPEETTVPRLIRRFFRHRELGLVLAGIVVGIASGVLVAAVALVAHGLQAWLFDLPAGVDLSVAPALDPLRTVLGPVLGGLAMAAMTLWWAPRLKGMLADAIEANALLGGRMSMRGSLFITAQTVASNGSGASVGLEAAFTQICGAVGSLFGRSLAARRSDMRLLVACGAAGAISAAFSAPLAGAFYAFELVLGAYITAGFVPVVASAFVATMVARQLAPHAYLMLPGFPTPASGELALQAAVIGAIAALAAIGLMVAVSSIERLCSRLKRLRPAFRPLVGGLALGLLGLASPVVLGAGHGALQISLVSGPTIAVLAAALALKLLASAISLGTGFRGGLFFSSLLLGALVGQLYAALVAMVAPDLALQPGTAAIAGMAAFGTGVLAAPVAMICLALGTTGDFSVTAGAVVAAAVSGLIVRELFGYSFATWRFHQRGEGAIRGPHDIGWMQQLSASVLMRTDVPSVTPTTPIGIVRTGPATASAKQLAVVEADGAYRGLVFAADLHAATDRDEEPILVLARQQEGALAPYASIRTIARAFAEQETDVLAVVPPLDGRFLGTVTEAHVLRRYGEELERRNEEIIFG